MRNAADSAQSYTVCIRDAAHRLGIPLPHAPPTATHVRQPVLPRAQSRQLGMPTSFTSPPTIRIHQPDGAAQERLDLPILALCLMPNHVHLVVRPDGRQRHHHAGLHWLFTTHARHYHEKYGTTGRLWQGRYKAFLVQDDHYLLTLMRYVERNALRKNLVARAEDWRWGSLNWRVARATRRLTLPPPPCPAGELARIRESAADSCRTRSHPDQRQSPAALRRSRLGERKGPRCGPESVIGQCGPAAPIAGPTPFASKWGVTPFTRA